MSFRRLLRAIIVGIALGACVGFGIYYAKHTVRIREVRSRVLPSLGRDLASSGFVLGSPAFIRIFKETRELELWIKPKGSPVFKHWKTWPVAGMSGKLGPKLKEGDNQAPEGFYEVPARALNPLSDFHLSFNVGYPNAFDRAHARTGGFIMVHGKKSSIGCFAMTDPVIEQIYLVVERALGSGQEAVPVHVFPFRMTDERMARAQSEHPQWVDFWKDLREGYIRFENGHSPPQAKVIDKRYQF